MKAFEDLCVNPDCIALPAKLMGFLGQVKFKNTKRRNHHAQPMCSQRQPGP